MGAIYHLRPCAQREAHQKTVRGGGKLNVQSAVLHRLLPAAPLTVTVQGRRDSI